MKIPKTLKGLVCLIIFSVILICFTACNSSNKTNFNSQANNTNNLKEYTIISKSGMAFSKFVFTNNGFYEIVSNSNGSGNILYTDYGLKQRMYLSTDINSKHDTKSDTSYVEFVVGGISTIGTQNKLYMIKRSRPTMIQDATDEGKSYLEQMDYNGENHKRIYLKNNEYFSENGSVAFDNENLVMIIYHFTKGDDLDPESVKEQRIIEINEKTGKINVLYTFSGKGNFAILGAINEQLVIAQNTFPIPSETNQSVQTNLFMLNPVTGEKTELNHIPDDNKRKFIVQNDKILYYDLQKNSLMQADLSGKVVVLKENVVPSGIIFDSASLVAEIFDGRVFLSVTNSENGETFKFAIKLSDYTVTEVPEYHNNEPILIYAEGEDYFMVFNGKFEVPYQTVDEEGNIYDSVYGDNKRYLIKKSDYWAGNIILEEIKDDYLFN